MRESRILRLRKESLVHLTAAEAVRVGGASGVTCAHATCAHATCDGGACDSDFVECLTGMRCVSLVDVACGLSARAC